MQHGKVSFFDRNQPYSSVLGKHRVVIFLTFYDCFIKILKYNSAFWESPERFSKKIPFLRSCDHIFCQNWTLFLFISKMKCWSFLIYTFEVGFAFAFNGLIVDESCSVLFKNIIWEKGLFCMNLWIDEYTYKWMNFEKYGWNLKEILLWISG